MLDGLWYGAESAKRAFIFIHGLTASVFSQAKVLPPLVDESTGVLYFNNRGTGHIAKVKRRDESSEKGYTSEMIGCAHEVFTDCVDDIQGAIDFVKSRGAEEIYLVGHSTGCQKSIYYASDEQRANNISGIVLLCPLSDYAYAMGAEKEAATRGQKVAQALVDAGEQHALMPQDVWPELIDAQRFISLYTPDSPEEIFKYWTPETEPKTYSAVTLPVLTVFASADEYADRSAEELAAWFKEKSSAGTFKSVIIKDALHNLSGYEDQVATAIEEWAK